MNLSALESIPHHWSFVTLIRTILIVLHVKVTFVEVG